jgi:hypothetical protein
MSKSRQAGKQHARVYPRAAGSAWRACGQLHWGQMPTSTHEPAHAPAGKPCIECAGALSSVWLGGGHMNTHGRTHEHANAHLKTTNARAATAPAHHQYALKGTAGCIRQRSTLRHRLGAPTHSHLPRATVAAHSQRWGAARPGRFMHAHNAAWVAHALLGA